MELKQYSLYEIEEKLWNGELPFSGITLFVSLKMKYFLEAISPGISAGYTMSEYFIWPSNITRSSWMNGPEHFTRMCLIN